MNRRRAGLLVLAAVAVVAIAVSAVNGSLSGSAGPIPLRDRPAVGDCLLANVSASTGTLPTTVTTSPTASGLPTPAGPVTPPGGMVAAQNPGVLSSAPCHGARYGEITGITDFNGSAPTTGSLSAQDVCAAATTRYVNGSALGIATSGRAGVWSPTAQFSSLVVRPSARQIAAGQAWVACALVQLDAAGRAVRYGGTVRDVTTADHLSHLIGTCLSDADLQTAEAVDCAQPHPAEKFATIYANGQGQSLADLLQSCQTLIGKMMQSPLNPTSGLWVVVDTSGSGDGDAKDLAPHGSAICGIAARNGQQLTGSLLGIGQRPLPWK